MAEHGMIFSAPMVRAIGAGRKTQTRRLDTGRKPYEVGDVLWIRETWNYFDPYEDCPVPIPPERWGKRAPWQGCQGDRPIYWTAVYRADGEIVHPINGPARWRSPIHMPRWAARYTLKVTEIRRQQLQEISDEDAIAEGLDIHRDIRAGSMRIGFAELWDKINGARRVRVPKPWPQVNQMTSEVDESARWEANPTVYAYTFKVL